MAWGDPSREGYISNLLVDLGGSCKVIDGITTANQVGYSGRGRVGFITTRVARGLV